MTDDTEQPLVERLRWSDGWFFENPWDHVTYASDDPFEAADEIERLREALNEIKRLLSYANQDAVNEAIAQGNKNMAWHKARAALGETK